MPTPYYVLFPTCSWKSLGGQLWLTWSPQCSMAPFAFLHCRAKSDQRVGLQLTPSPECSSLRCHYRPCKARGSHEMHCLFSIPGKITKFFYFYKTFFFQWTPNVLLMLLAIALYRKILGKNYQSDLTDEENWDKEIEYLAWGCVASQFSSQEWSSLLCLQCLGTELCHCEYAPSELCEGQY